MDLEKQVDSIQYKTNFRNLLRSLKDSYVVMREEGMDEEEITAYFMGFENDGVACLVDLWLERDFPKEGTDDATEN